jgi:hypothetical protein
MVKVRQKRGEKVEEGRKSFRKLIVVEREGFRDDSVSCDTLVRGLRSDWARFSSYERVSSCEKTHLLQL